MVERSSATRRWARSGTSSPGARSTPTIRGEGSSSERSSSTTQAVGGTHKKNVSNTFKNSCGRTPARRLALVPRVHRPRRQHWAFSRGNASFPTTVSCPGRAQAVWELRLSHWTTELPVLNVNSTGPTGSSTTCSAVHLPRQSRPRVQGEADTANRSTPGAATVRRHVQLTLRRRLEAREQLPDARRHRRPFRYGFYPHGQHPIGARLEVSRDDHRPGS